VTSSTTDPVGHDGTAFYRAVRPVVVGAVRYPWRVRLRGADRVPATGACILAPSHRSMMDIPFLAVVTSRRIRFMGKVEVFDVPVIGSLFRALGSFPVERDGSDRGPLRASLRILAAGDPLAVYPEGTRQYGPTIATLHEGTAYLALRSGAPIVPIGIAGSEEILRSRRHRAVPGLGRVAIVVGDPLVPAERNGKVVKRERVHELTARLHDELQRCFDEAYALRDR